MRPGVGGKGHEDDVFVAAVRDLPAGGDAFGIGVEDDLEQNSGIVSRGAGFFVLVPDIKGGKVYFVVEEIVKSVLEGAWKYLLFEADGNEFALGIIVFLVLRHTPPVGEGF